MADNTGGFDKPVASVDEDHLGRWVFAREVATIAMTAPRDWSVRIGVYGRWGYGKTSVLNMVRTIAEQSGHVVALFNPWSCGSEDDMREAFASAVTTQAQELGLDIPGVTKAKWKIFARKSARRAKPLVSIRPEAKAIAAAFGPSVQHWLDLKSVIASVPLALGGSKRVIVLVDDLDRTDPSLLPGLLFALREVLDTPGYSYVLALDPGVVGAALGAHHPGFGNGRQFLEKIVEFPRWLPEPTDEDLWRLVTSSAQRYCDFIDPTFLRQEFDLFPKVPRQIKAILRGFALLRSELERYDADEIHWPLLIVVQLLKALSQRFTHAVLTSGNLLANLLGSKIALHGTPDDELRECLRQLAVAADVETAERERAVDIAMRLGQRTPWLTDNLDQHAHLVERPLAVTWKEFRSLRASLGVNVSGEAVGLWILHHAKAHCIDERIVLKELFLRAVHSYEGSLSAAADAKVETDLKAYTDEARALLTFLDVISFELEGFTAQDTTFTIKDFARLKRVCFSWADFTNASEYLALRAHEADLLCRLVRTSTIDALVFLADLEPWNDGGWSNGNAVQLRNALAAAASKRAAADIHRIFEVEASIDSIVSDNAREAERYLLFRATSPAWAPQGIAAFQSLAQIGSATAIVRSNCTSFLAALASTRHPWVSRLDVEELIRMDAVMLPMWSVATMQRINVRFFSWFREQRIALEAVRGALPEPTWWKDIEARSGASTGAPATVQDVGSGN